MRRLNPLPSSAPLTLEGLAATMLTLGAFAASWNGLHLGSVQLVDLALMMALGLLVLTSLGTRRLWPARVPLWLFIASAAIALVIVARNWFPISPAYLSSRVDLQGLHGEPAPSASMAGLQWLVAILVLPMCVAGVSGHSTKRLERMMKAWAWGVGLSATVALTDRVGITAVSRALIGEGVDYGGRQAGLCAHANSLGVSSVMVFPVAVWIARRHPFRGLVLQLLLLVGVVLSGSRGAQALLGGLCVLMVFASPKSRTALVRLTIASAALSPLAVTLLGGLDEILGSLFRFGGAGDGSDSNSERAQIAVQALHDFALHPLFGVGLDQLTYAHNIYLQLASSGGLVLLTAVMLFFLSAVIQGWSQRRQHDLVFYLIVSLVAWLTIGMVENSLVDRFLYFPVGAIVGYAAADRAQRSAGAENPAGRDS